MVDFDPMQRAVGFLRLAPKPELEVGHLYSKAIFFKHIVYRSLLVHRKKTSPGITVPYPYHRVAIKGIGMAVIVYPIEDGG